MHLETNQSVAEFRLLLSKRDTGLGRTQAACRYGPSCTILLNVRLTFTADHCLDSLRQVIMCHADLSLYTLEWTPHSRVKPAVRAPAPRMCVNYGKLQAWMLSRAAQVERMEGPSDPV